MLYDVNRYALSTETDLVLRDLTHFTPTDLRCTSTECFWTDQHGRTTSALVSDIAYVRFPGKEVRSLGSLMVGAALGAVVGPTTALAVKEAAMDNRVETGNQIRNATIYTAVGANLGLLGAMAPKPTDIHQDFLVCLFWPEERFISHANTLTRPGLHPGKPDVEEAIRKQNNNNVE